MADKFVPATKKQVALMRRCGIRFAMDISISEAADLLSDYLANNNVPLVGPATDKQKQTLDKFKINYSKKISKQRASDLISAAIETRRGASYGDDLLDMDNDLDDGLNFGDFC